MVGKKSAVLGAGLALAFSGCNEKFPKVDHAYMQKQYDMQHVYKCTGEALLRYNGHVRTSPDVSNDRNILPIIEEAVKARKQVILSAPQTLHLPKQSNAPSEWFIATMPDHGEVFVNRLAIAQDNLNCSQIAAPTETKPGPIVVR